MVEFSIVGSSVVTVGEYLTLKVTEMDSTKPYYVVWVPNYNSSADDYPIGQSQYFRKQYANTTSGNSQYSTIITTEDANRNIQTLTPFYFNNHTDFYSLGEFEAGTLLGDYVAKGETFEVSINNGKRITGIITWLKEWFYDKTEIDTQIGDTGWTQLSYVSGYSNYSSDNPLRIRKYGKFVEIRGVFKPTAQKTASTEAVQFATVPSGYRPPTQLRVAICQGSGINKWALTVTTDGKIGWSRYGTTSSSNVPSGAWMCVHITYMVDS